MFRFVPTVIGDTSLREFLHLLFLLALVIAAAGGALFIFVLVSALLD